MLKLHYDMITYNTLGTGNVLLAFMMEVLKIAFQKNEYKNLPKCFFTYTCVEKYFKKKLLDDPDRVFIKKLVTNILINVL